MNSIFSGPQLAYLIIAVIVLGLAFAGIVWVGRMIRGELGSGATRGGSGGGGSMAMLEQIPPAMMKEAIARGLVVPSQLAGMTDMERTFLFASLKQKLAAARGEASASAPPVALQAAPAPAPAAPAAATTTAPAAVPPAAAPVRSAPALPGDLPPGMVALLNAEKLRIWCPMCGTELQLPTFPPILARCAKCGMKSAVRSEEGGRYVLNISPPPRGQ